MLSKKVAFICANFLFSILFNLTAFAGFENYLVTDLTSENNHADYIVISHQKFFKNLSGFLDWRASMGLDIILVDVSDIVSQFNSAGSRGEAIRQFVSYTQTNWQKPSPKYLFLVNPLGKRNAFLS